MEINTRKLLSLGTFTSENLISTKLGTSCTPAVYADTQAVHLLWQVRLPGRVKWSFVGDGHLNDPVAPCKRKMFSRKKIGRQKKEFQKAEKT